MLMDWVLIVEPYLNHIVDRLDIEERILVTQGLQTSTTPADRCPRSLLPICERFLRLPGLVLLI